MKKKTIIIITLTVIIFIGAIFFGFRTREIRKNMVKIIDVTENCPKGVTTEKFYEDDNYIYLFPCVKSNSIFAKFPNGNKMLVIKALEEEKVTIDELIKAGLEVEKKEKDK